MNAAFIGTVGFLLLLVGMGLVALFQSVPWVIQ